MLTFSVLKVVHNLPEKRRTSLQVGTSRTPRCQIGQRHTYSEGHADGPAHRWGGRSRLSHLRETWTCTAFMLVLHHTTKTTLYTSPIYRRSTSLETET